MQDGDELNYSLMKAAKCEVVRGVSPVPLMKAVKTAAEQEGFRRAMCATAWRWCAS